MSDGGKQILSVTYDCGAVHRFSCAHYTIALQPCGRKFWALQPKRGGELKLFPWPGLPLTRRELAEKEAHDELRQAEGQTI